MLFSEDHRSVVYSLAFSPDGNTLASGARDGSLVLCEANGERQPLLEPGQQSPAIHAIAFLPDGSLVIGHAHGWHTYRREAGSWRAFSPPHATPTTSLALLDPTLLAVGTGDRVKPTSGHFELWDLKNGKRVEPHFPEPNGVRAVATCPERKLVAWATGHRALRVWDIRKQTPINYMQPKNSTAIALSPDGLTMAAAMDHEAKLFCVERRRERFTLKGHRGLVAAIAFSPDGSVVATGSWDHTVRIWDAQTGRERSTFKWPIGRITSLAYAPDGLRMAAGSDAGAVVVWDLE